MTNITENSGLCGLAGIQPLFFFFISRFLPPVPTRSPLLMYTPGSAPTPVLVCFETPRYGNWAGVGSASVPGSTVYAKRAATAAVQHIRGGNSFDSSKVAVEAAMTGQLSGRGGSLPGQNAPASRAWPTSRLASGAAVAAGKAAVQASVKAGIGARGARDGDDERVMAA